MKSRIHKAKIRYLGFVEDPVSDSALRLDFEVQGPSEYVENVNVYFSDRFIESYFRIPWNRKLDAEENRLIHTKNSLFLKWGLAKVEAFLKAVAGETKIYIEHDKDLLWAKAVESGEIALISRKISEDQFDYAD